MSKSRIVVGGYLGLLPTGGITWDYVQYPVGLAQLGYDVYYIEDTRLWPVFQNAGHVPADCSANVAHLAAVMDFFGLPNRWAYRDEISGRCFGLSEGSLMEVCRTADVFINVSCSTVLRDEYRGIPIRILIDSDPMFTQMQYTLQSTFTPGEPGMRALIEGHTHHFTFGENVGSADCRIPMCGVSWRPTRQPICLSYWPYTPLPDHPEFAYTTVMNWAAAPPVAYGGEAWGQKDQELLKFIDVPTLVPAASFALAVGQTTGAPFPLDSVQQHGWHVLDPLQRIGHWTSYQAFIRDSRGEFSVAKDTYVKANTGWFSCRSACYLATGRPVITQDTRWSRYLPTGCGLLSFTGVDSAVKALLQVEKEPEKHSRAARQIATEYFDSNKVLGDLVRQAGL